MSKHTPGPWEIAPIACKYYGTEINLPDGNRITVWTPDRYADPFASVREVENGWEPEDGHDHVEDVRSYANARLIAAAPTLLQALRGTEFALVVADGYEDKTDMSDLLGTVRAAIAKATGEGA